MSEARARLRELHAKIEAFFARVDAAMPGALTCHRGCSDCCHRRFSVTEIEAELVRDALAALDAATRERLRERASRDDGRCPALEANGECAVYEARPVICRTHGLALRFRDVERRTLPLLDACPKNFKQSSLDAIDPRLVLDQELVSTMLLAIDAVRASERGTVERAAGTRVDLDEIIRAP